MNTIDISPIHQPLVIVNQLSELWGTTLCIYLYVVISVWFNQQNRNIYESLWIWGSIYGVPPNGCFVREHPIKMDDWGVPLFQETSIWYYTCTIYIIVPILIAHGHGRIYVRSHRTSRHLEANESIDSLVPHENTGIHGDWCQNVSKICNFP